MVRRIVTPIVSFCAVLGLALLLTGPTWAQAPSAKKEAAAPTPTPTKEATAAKPDTTQKPADTKGAEAKPADTAKAKEATQATEPPLPPIPREVEEKLAAARKAVAEAIVAAQDAGLVETSIDPPPVLDILITGRAVDARTLKNPAKKKNGSYGVSPEVFAAWFTGYEAPGFENIDRQKEIRIIFPSDGLKAYFDQRAVILREAIAEVRKARGGSAAARPAEKKPEPRPEAKPAEKKPEAKPAEKKPEAKPAAEPAKKK